MIEKIACPCCGAPVNDLNAPCMHCGIQLRESNGGGISAIENESCPKCGSKCYEGQDVCLNCYTVISPSKKLDKKIKKVCFSQDKFRSNFIPEVQAAFDSEEFLLADTYGRYEYYILTTQKLIICEIKNGILSGSTTLCGPKNTVLFDNVTRMTSWSELWYVNGNAMNPAEMSMQIETFQGEINLDVFAFQPETGFLGKVHYFKDPFFFGAIIQEAFRFHEAEKHFYDHVLYTIGKKSDSSTAIDSSLESDSKTAELTTAIVEPFVPPKTYKLNCKCGASLKIKEKDFGKTGVCPKCQQKVRIPIP